MSGMMPVLENLSIGPNGEILCIYGDPAYPLKWYLQGPFRSAKITLDQNEFNKRMSKVRISVEWLFGNVIENFMFSDYRQSQKIGLSSIGVQFIYIFSKTENNAFLKTFKVKFAVRILEKHL